MDISIVAALTIAIMAVIALIAVLGMNLVKFVTLKSRDRQLAKRSHDHIDLVNARIRKLPGEKSQIV